jgi:hypothetical protein
MDFQNVKETFFAGLLLAPFFSTEQMVASNTVVVAHCDWMANNQVYRGLFQCFPGFSQQIEQGQEQIHDPMSATVEAVLSQNFGNITMLLQLHYSFFDINSVILCRHKSRGHDFGIIDLALRINEMVKCFQHIVTKVKYYYNLAIHAILRFRSGFVTINFIRSRMDFGLEPLSGILG